MYKYRDVPGDIPLDWQKSSRRQLRKGFSSGKMEAEGEASLKEIPTGYICLDYIRVQLKYLTRRPCVMLLVVVQNKSTGGRRVLQIKHNEEIHVCMYRKR